MGWGTALLRGCRTLVGVDISDEAITEARERYGRRAEFIVGDMSRLEFGGAAFDTVVCLEGIEHVPLETGRAFMSESARVLRQDGVLLLSSPCSRDTNHSGNPYHVEEYSFDEIRALIRPFYDIDGVIQRDVGNLLVYYIHATRKQ